MTQIHEIYPYPSTHHFWAFKDEKLKITYKNAKNLWGTWNNVTIEHQMGRILEKLLGSQGIKMPEDNYQYWPDQLARPEFKLSFSSEIFPEYQIKLQFNHQSQKNTAYYRVIEGPGSKSKGSKYRLGAISEPRGSIGDCLDACPDPEIKGDIINCKHLI